MYDQLWITQTGRIPTNLDPVLIPPVQDILPVGVFKDQTFSPGLHNNFHTFSDVLGSLTLILSHKFDTTLLFGEAGTEVPFAELA